MDASSPPSSRVSRWRAAIPILVLLGTAYRIQQFLAARDFENDESSLLLNVASKSARQLLGTLDRSQAAPPIFLEILRGCYYFGGDSELSMRAWPMLAGVFALFVFAAVAWRVLPAAQAVIVVALFAFSDTLVWYSVEVKQYSSDVLMCVLVLLMAVAARPASVVARLWCIAIFTAVAVWASHPVIFVFAGVSLALLPAVLKQRRGALQFLAANLLVAVSFAALYILSIRVQKTAVLTEMWESSFVPWSHPTQIPLWLGQQILAIADYPVQGPGGVLLLILATWGAIALIKRRRPAAIWLLAPIALPLLGSMAWAFPFTGGRITLFLSPIVLLLAGAGMNAWQHADRAWLRRTWLVFPMILLGWSSALAVHHLFRAESRRPLRPALAYLRQHRRPGDGVYVVGRDTPSIFSWYWRNDPAPFVCKPSVDAPDVPIPFDHYWVIGIFNPKRDRATIAHDLQWASHEAIETDRTAGANYIAARFERITQQSKQETATRRAPPP